MPATFTKYVLPISGTDFVKYTAFYSVLSEYKLKPRQIYSASGGCLASYLAMMSSFNKEVEDWDVNSNMLIEKTSPFKMRTLTYISKGYFYRRPDTKAYIRQTFVPSKMRDAEIISGYFKTDSKRLVITTNYTAENSSITDAQVNRLKSRSTDILYGPSDIDELFTHVSETIQRTSGIPYLLESDDRCSIDFGIAAPSPMQLLNIDPHASVYFSPVNLDGDFMSTLANSVYYRMILNEVISIENRFAMKQTCGSLEEVFAMIENRTRYALIIYTRADIDISITCFDRNEIKKGVEYSKAEICFVVLYD